MSFMYCDVCHKYKDRLQGMRNFSSTWLTGSTNQRESSVIDHAKSEQHKSAMSRLRAEEFNGMPLTSSAPIVSLLTTMDAHEKAQVCRKFKICYVLARQGLALLKYPAFHALTERQGVDIGYSYRKTDSARQFTHFITETLRQRFLESLSGISFVSFLLDGSTDTGNVEQELVFVQYFYKDDSARQIFSYARGLAVVSPESADNEEILACLDRALYRVGISKTNRVC